MRRIHILFRLAGLTFALLHFGLLIPSLSEHFSTDNRVLFIFGPVILGILIITITTALLAVRRGLLTSSWGWLHLLNYVIFIMAAAHGLVIGDDGSRLSTRIVFSVFLALAYAGFLYRVRIHDWRHRFRYSPRTATDAASVFSVKKLETGS